MISDMSKTSADLVKAWQAERLTLEQKFAHLKIEGDPLSASQMEVLATLDSLIADFSRHDDFSIVFEDTKLRMRPAMHLCNERPWDYGRRLMKGAASHQRRPGPAPGSMA
jgi:hypothetical protein